MDEAVDHMVADWIAGDSRARLVVDGNLTAHWVSASAETLMSASNSLFRLNGRMLPRDVRLQGEFRSFVNRATDDVSDQCISDSETGEQMLVTATRLRGPWDHLVGVTLQPAGDNFRLRLADLRQAFKFTPREALIAYHLFCGHTADQTADELNVSLDTVRTHIKRAYAKLGVSSREGFFHKLTPFVISLS
jgi:DNA-binding CsgD family transcriptional regulator